jgi:hypothetical protein
MSRLIAWWRRVSPWARADAAECSRAMWEELYMLSLRDLVAERHRNEHLTRVARGAARPRLGRT